MSITISASFTKVRGNARRVVVRPIFNPQRRRAVRLFNVQLKASGHHARLLLSRSTKPRLKASFVSNEKLPRHSSRITSQRMTRTLKGCSSNHSKLCPDTNDARLTSREPGNVLETSSGVPIASRNLRDATRRVLRSGPRPRYWRSRLRTGHS